MSVSFFVLRKWDYVLQIEHKNRKIGKYKNLVRDKGNLRYHKKLPYDTIKSSGTIWHRILKGFKGENRL